MSSAVKSEPADFSYLMTDGYSREFIWGKDDYFMLTAVLETSHSARPVGPLQ